jgi:hypothetical protein
MRCRVCLTGRVHCPSGKMNLQMTEAERDVGHRLVVLDRARQTRMTCPGRAAPSGSPARPATSGGKDTPRVERRSSLRAGVAPRSQCRTKPPGTGREHRPTSAGVPRQLRAPLPSAIASSDPPHARSSAPIPCSTSTDLQDPTSGAARPVARPRPAALAAPSSAGAESARRSLRPRRPGSPWRSRSPGRVRFMLPYTLLLHYPAHQRLLVADASIYSLLSGFTLLRAIYFAGEA